MTSAEPAVIVLVFARAPVPGVAKTRLIPALGAEGAALLQQRMTEHALATARAAGIGPVALWCAPSIEHPFFQACRAQFGVALHCQCGATLGERLLAAHDSAFSTHARLLVIGSDCPSLSADDLRSAAAELARSHAVVIPAEDGGYVLLGLARTCPEAFRDIAWGGAQVLAQTLERFRAAKLSYALRPALWDVDRLEDVVRLGIQVPALVEGLTIDGASNPC